jgi:CBS domain containing-hemolysin-like protein
MALTQLLDFTGTKDESQLSQRLEELNKHTLAEVMTPRSIIVALDADVQLKRVRRLKSSKVSYYPVYERDLDHILGWIPKTKVIELLEIPSEAVNLRQYLRPVGIISEDTRVSELAEHFLRSRSPFLVVRNSIRQTVGIVQLTEFVELLFGFEMGDAEVVAHDANVLAAPTSILDRA